MAKQFDCRPSELLQITDAYTAYCFDEACMYITTKIENKQQPKFIEHKENNVRHYSSPSELYKSILRR